MEHAAHRCQKLKMGEVDFNPEINTLRSRILAGNLQISKLQGCCISSCCLQRAIVSANLPLGSFDLSLSGALSTKKANFKACKAAKKNHVSARVSWLHSLACTRSSQDDGKTEDQHVKSLITIEKQRRQARNVKRTTHKLKSFGTPRIVAPDSNGNWVEQTSKEDIESGCTWETQGAFHKPRRQPRL
jgi:hypothetical protein